jgi:hypothetical protein
MKGEIGKPGIWEGFAVSGKEYFETGKDRPWKGVRICSIWRRWDFWGNGRQKCREWKKNRDLGWRRSEKYG